jgi:hypothetical protein
MTSRAVTSTGDFDVFRTKHDDRRELASCYMQEMDRDQLDEISVEVDIGSMEDVTLMSVVGQYEIELTAQLLCQIQANFVDQMQSTLDEYWEGMR